MVEAEVKKRYYELLEQGYSPSVALRKTETEFGEPGSEKRERLRSDYKHTEARRPESRHKDVKTKTFGRAKTRGGFLSDLTSAGRSVVRGIEGVDRYIESPGFQSRVGRVHGMSTSFFGYGEEPRKKKKHHRKTKKRQNKKGKNKRVVKIYL